MTDHALAHAALSALSAEPDNTVSATAALKRVSSHSLLGPSRELVIDHNGREYRLRLTQNGKLILTA